MPRLRNLNGNFAIVPSSILRDKNISARAMGIYARICDLPNNYPINGKSLLPHFKEGRDAIYTAYKELFATGYLSKQARRHQDGSFHGWDIQLVENPKKPKESSTLLETGLHVTGNPDTGFQSLKRSNTFISNNPLPPEKYKTTVIPETGSRGAPAPRQRKRSLEATHYTENVHTIRDLYDIKWGRGTVFDQRNMEAIDRAIDIDGFDMVLEGTKKFMRKYRLWEEQYLYLAPAPSVYFGDRYYAHKFDHKDKMDPNRATVEAIADNERRKKKHAADIEKSLEEHKILFAQYEMKIMGKYSSRDVCHKETEKILFELLDNVRRKGIDNEVFNELDRRAVKIMKEEKAKNLRKFGEQKNVSSK